MYAVQGPDSVKAMNAMLDEPVDELKRFGICERKLGDIPVYIHRSGFTGENGYEFTPHSTRVQKFTIWRSKPSNPSEAGSFRRSRSTSVPSRWKRASRSSRTSST